MQPYYMLAANLFSEQTCKIECALLQKLEDMLTDILTIVVQPSCCALFRAKLQELKKRLLQKNTFFLKGRCKFQKRG